jgi:hypothetical protein
MRGDFMSGLGNLLDEAGVSERDPAKDEERGANAVPIQEIEELTGVRNDAARKLIPPIGAGQRRDVANVKPLLDIDGQAIADHVKSSASRFGAATCLDEIDDGSNTPQDALPHLFVGHHDGERSLKLEHDLERVDRIEAQAVAEQQHVVLNIGRPDRHPQTSDDGCLDLIFERILRVQMSCLS